jgi:hypothetical protein
MPPERKVQFRSRDLGGSECSQQQAKMPNGLRDHQKGLSAISWGRSHALLLLNRLRASVAAPNTAFDGHPSTALSNGVQVSHRRSVPMSGSVIRVGLAAYRRLPLCPYKQTSQPYVGMSQSHSRYFAPQYTAHYSTVRSTMAPRSLSASNRRGIVRFGDQHYLGGHRSWT